MHERVGEVHRRVSGRVMRMMGRRSYAGLVLWALVGVVPAVAAAADGLLAAAADAPAAEPTPDAASTTEPVEDAPSPWHFEIEPYAWISANYGTAHVDGYTAHLAVTPYDVLDAVFDGKALAAGGFFSVGYERWSVFADVFGGGAKVDVDEDIPTPYCTLTVSAKDRVRIVLADFALSYRITQLALPNRARPFELGVYAGARYMHFSNDLSGGVAVVGGKRYGGDASAVNNWADPIIGVRWSLPVLDDVTATFRGDIGGFGASSKIDWGLVGDVRWWLSWRPWSMKPYLAAGYRIVGIDRSPSSSANVDLQIRGPLMGMGFAF